MPDCGREMQWLPGAKVRTRSLGVVRPGTMRYTCTTQSIECVIELQLKFREDYIFTFTFYLLCEIFANLRLKLLCNVT